MGRTGVWGTQRGLGVREDPLNEEAWPREVSKHFWQVSCEYPTGGRGATWGRKSLPCGNT